MKRTITMIAPVFAVLVLAGIAHAQATSSLSVTVGPEASLSASATALTTSGTTFSDYTGTTNLTYKIRTTKVTGTGTITAKVTTDFSPAGGPLVATSGTTGDTLTYTCTVTAPGTACSGSQTSSTAASTPFATFGAAANSAKAGNTASAVWDLVNDPAYGQGSYSATVTFTISAT
jgi:hypothetical protein